MQQFDLEDIVEHLQNEFPELTKKSVKMLTKAYIREISHRATVGRPLALNTKFINVNKDKDMKFYALYMPAPQEVMYGKIFKYDRRGKKQGKK